MTFSGLMVRTAQEHVSVSGHSQTIAVALMESATVKMALLVQCAMHRVPWDSMGKTALLIALVRMVEPATVSQETVCKDIMT